MFQIRTALAAVFMMMPISATAQQIVASDASSVANFFLEEGFEPTVEIDSVGDPLVKVDYYGTSFSIFYYGCTDGSDCDAIQFFKGYRTEGSVRLVKLNEWNAEKRYAVAYNSDSGSARIEYDLYLGRSGLSSDDFAEVVSKWMRAIKDFEDFIDW